MCMCLVLSDSLRGRSIHAMLNYEGPASFVKKEAVVRRHGRSGHLLARSSAAGLERAVCKASHHPQRHEDRPLGGGAEDGGFLGG